MSAFAIFKKLTQAIVGILFIILFIGLFWQIFIASGMKRAESCFTNGAKLSEEFYAQIVLQKPSNARDQMICESAQSNYKALEACLKTTAKEHKLAFLVFSSLPSFKNTMRELVESQNSKCPNQPITDFNLN